MGKTLIGTALAVAAALSFATPALSADLVVWHSYRGEEKAAFEKAIADYNAANAGKHKVTTLAVAFDAFADKISAAVPRGQGPDVFIYAQDRLGGWIEAGKTIEPLDFFLDENVKKRFLPGMLDAMTYRGQVYGLPLNFKAIAMYYNKALVKAPPATTGELVKTAKALTNPAAGQFGLVYWYSNFYYHAPLWNGFGAPVFDAQRRPVLNNPEGVRSLELLLKWVDKDKILPAEPSTALVTQLFNKGKAAIVFSGPWFLGEIDSAIGFGLATLPTIDEAGGKPMKPWTTVEGLYIAAPSKNKDAAYELIKYLSDVPAAKILALQGRQTPANRDVYADKDVAADPILRVFRQQVENSIPMPNYAEMAMFWTPITTAMNTIVQKSASPKAALDVAQKETVERISTLRVSPKK
ncbi:MAG: extracellular solute-binding protein [Acidobacteria bacterium]|nr:extracellular solute-binding protein [Acidobacteriota bacterium]